MRCFEGVYEAMESYGHDTHLGDTLVYYYMRGVKVRGVGATEPATPHAFVNRSTAMLLMMTIQQSLAKIQFINRLIHPHSVTTYHR